MRIVKRLLFLSVLMVFLALAAVLPVAGDEPQLQLSAPTNLHYEGDYFVWTPVIGAESYNVRLIVNERLTDRVENTTECRYYFPTDRIPTGNSYGLAVSAVGKGYLDSPYASTLDNRPMLQISSTELHGAEILIHDTWSGRAFHYKDDRIAENGFGVTASSVLGPGDDKLVNIWTIPLQRLYLNVIDLPDDVENITFIFKTAENNFGVTIGVGDRAFLKLNESKNSEIVFRCSKNDIRRGVKMGDHWPWCEVTPQDIAEDMAFTSVLPPENIDAMAYLSLENVVRCAIHHLDRRYHRAIRGDKLIIYPGTRRDHASLPDYSDVTKGDWFYDDVMNASKFGVMIGTAGDKFEPETALTRAMAATILYRMAEEPKVEGNSGFSDVPAGKWFSDAVTWAAQTKIVEGMGDGKFSPNAALTRDQFATMMKRYAEHMKYPVLGQADLSGFEDVAEVRDWAKESLQWTVIQGLLTGKTATTLDPQDTTTRAEVSAIIIRFLKTIGG